VKQRVAEVLRIGIIGIPVAQVQVGFAVTHGGPDTRRIPLDDLDPDAQDGQILLDRLGDPSKLGSLVAPEAKGKTMAVSGLSQQAAGLSRVPGVGYPS